MQTSLVVIYYELKNILKLDVPNVTPKNYINVNLFLGNVNKEEEINFACSSFIRIKNIL